MVGLKCTATNRQGKRCGKAPIPGGTVCRMHGGAAPQVKEAAMERLRQLQHPAIDALAWLITQRDFPSAAMSAARDVLDRTEGKAAETVAMQHSGGIAFTHEIPE
jgi:hypothetical protein